MKTIIISDLREKSLVLDLPKKLLNNAQGHPFVETILNVRLN